MKPFTDRTSVANIGTPNFSEVLILIFLVPLKFVVDPTAGSSQANMGITKEVLARHIAAENPDLCRDKAMELLKGGKATESADW